MAVSTTLMTFKVRTPPATRSVDLYGSWDNFTKAYPMSRDVRLGIEHWSGCHSFENIICDGDVTVIGPSRNGGLKMGGTYWYYYKLDDEIEFHNSAEPATTRCPLLPGQLINELQVPFAFSSRKRDTSIDSTNSERRTLDPKAKFTNPCPAPQPPRLMRLNTSPTLIGPLPPVVKACAGSISAEASTRIHREDLLGSASSRIFRLPRKSSLDGLLRAQQSKQNPARFRTAFEVSSHGASENRGRPYKDIVNWIPDEPITVQGQIDVTSQVQEPYQESAPQSARRSLLLRSNSDEVFTLSSFSEHRRQRSRSRSHSRNRSNRNSLALNEAAHLELNPSTGLEQKPLPVLVEVNTPACTPGYGPLTGRRITLEALEGRNEARIDLDKRLPSLPSTAIPESQQTEPAHSPPYPAEEPESRFSATTIDSTDCTDTVLSGDEEDFVDDSGWSQASESTIEESLYSSPFAETNFAPVLRPISSNPAAFAEMMGHNEYRFPQILSSKITCTTFSPTASATPTISYGEHDNSDLSRFSHVTTIRSSGGSFDHFQHYSLPRVENASEITLKRLDVGSDVREELDRNRTAHHARHMSHSEGMQQLLDELSYLSGMIQS